MSDLRDAARQALEALEEYQEKGAPFLACDAAVAALRAALEQPEQEPVALQKLLHQVICGDFNADNTDDLKLALAARKEFAALQPRREWRGLTEEEREVARAIEAALKEKNHD